MKKLLLVFLFTTSYSVIAGSYDDNLKELFELTGIKTNYNELNNVIVNQMQAGFFQAVEQNINANSYNEEQRKQIGELLKNRFSKMVENYKEFIEESMPYEKVESEIYLPLYKETYTESEVDELLTFYKSPIGQKTIEVGQKISQQAVEKSAEKYDEIIVAFVKNEIEENVETIKKEIDEKGIKHIQ